MTNEGARVVNVTSSRPRCWQDGSSLGLSILCAATPALFPTSGFFVFFFPAICPGLVTLCRRFRDKMVRNVGKQIATCVFLMWKTIASPAFFYTARGYSGYTANEK